MQSLKVLFHPVLIPTKKGFDEPEVWLGERKVSKAIKKEATNNTARTIAIRFFLGFNVAVSSSTCYLAILHRLFNSIFQTYSSGFSSGNRLNLADVARIFT